MSGASRETVLIPLLFLIVLAVTMMSAGSDVTYYAGSGWDKSGDFKTVEDWDRYLEQAVLRLRSPLAVSVAAK